MPTNCWYICNVMSHLIDNIISFLDANGFSCSHMTEAGIEAIRVDMQDGTRRIILPLEISAKTEVEAKSQADERWRFIASHSGEHPLIITEDRWHSQRECMEARILAHLEVFKPIYARNCEIRRIDKDEARDFLEKNHSYGHAVCRYCYGLFFKRHTGHIARNAEADNEGHIMPGQLMAVATFSNARKWIKGDKVIKSYEWTRYASLPQVRLSGGMGRMLKAFIKDVQPDDIMSYADLEWSEGDVYRQLGFELEDKKEPVIFRISKDWQRVPVKGGSFTDTQDDDIRHFLNFGSNKYRLKLTDYE